jgi:hypothetical protein
LSESRWRLKCAAALSVSNSSQPATKSSASCATTTASPYSEITSSTAVLTTGFSAAMYSSVWVGLMKRVCSLSAKGIRHTSQPASR